MLWVRLYHATGADSFACPIENELQWVVLFSDMETTRHGELAPQAHCETRHDDTRTHGMLLGTHVIAK